MTPARPEPVGTGGRALIFLDVDGVLNSIRSMIAYQSGREFDAVAVRLLDRLCIKLTDAGKSPEVVISSTWRILHPRIRWWTDLWAHYGCIAIRTVGMTPDFGDNEPNRRGREVLKWMQTNGAGDPYVCLDDDSDFLPGQPLVLIDHSFGLQVAHINEAFRVLTGPEMESAAPAEMNRRRG